MADRIITLEAVLPNGELIRTGSAALQGQERSNPYFRQAYGPDITGLFRQSLGSLGVVTEIVYRLLPMGEREEFVDAGFSDMESFLRAMQRIERHDIASATHGCNKGNMALITVPDIEMLKRPVEFRKYRSSLPEFSLCVELSGTDEQVGVYKRIVKKIVKEEGGDFFTLTGKTKENYRDLVEGAGIRVNRMFYYTGGAAIFVLPLSQVLDAKERTISMCREYGMKDPSTGEPFVPPMFIVPNERCTIVYMEMDIPLAAVGGDLHRLTAFYRECTGVIGEEYHSSSMSLRPWLQSRLVPSYIQLVRSIKEAVDPNGIFAQDKILKGDRKG
jgi:FAD/FMN-containing dehydrogenase